MRFLAPGDVKGMGMLIEGRGTMYAFLPGFNKVRRLGLHVIAGAGHWVHVDRPAELLALPDAGLAALRGVASAMAQGDLSARVEGASGAR